MRVKVAVTLIGSLMWMALVPAAESPSKQVITPRIFHTSHGAIIGGSRIKYDATVEETFIADPAGKPLASVFSTSYVRTDVTNSKNRPVIFAFNGGPGSASLWLHMGFLGPKRVVLGDDDNSEEIHPRTTAPFEIAANPDSPLDAADIVLFDPPGTGFSRIVEGADSKQVYGVQQDARITSEFIRQWLEKHRRWNSPKYLFGESYGAMRAAVVAKLLMGGPTSTGSMEGITLNGVIVMGPALDSTIPTPEMAALTAIPSLAAAAWRHGKIDRTGKTLQQHVDEARAFVGDEYVRALHAGSALSSDQLARVAERLSQLIGLSADFLKESRLLIDTGTFSTELLRDQDKQIGIYDSRYILPLAPIGNDPVADDPAMGQYVPAFVGSISSYFKDELKVDLDLPYSIIEFRSINAQWDYGRGPGVPVSQNYAEDLGIAMRRNPALKLLVIGGYYDLATTIGQAEYALTHSGIDQGRVTWRLYESGHMAYIGAGNRRGLANDVRRFVGQ